VAGRIARGEVRLYQFAAPDKKRPALLLTRDSAIAYLSTVTVAPVTSTIRGVPSEVVLNEEDGMKSPCAVNLHNAVTVSQQRLGTVRRNDSCGRGLCLSRFLRSQSVASVLDLPPGTTPMESFHPSTSGFRTVSKIRTE
jgi:mRNA interferase MazF